ncbi:MAG: hypothetical protein GX573_27260 [Chloroflexi bacterium]|nr:hypothetical protein [Chloroflexota bacterium]
MQVEFDTDLFGGISVITGGAIRVEPATWPDAMYQPQSNREDLQQPFRFKAVPYYLWANRQPGEMRVWIRES